MIIRKAEKKDIHGIEELLVQVCLVHHHGRPDLFQYGKQKYTASQLYELLDNPDYCVFVAVSEDGKILAHAFCIHQEEKDHKVLTNIKTLYIDDICVHEDYRNEKIGKKLYNYVHRYAKEQGYYNITLNVWAFNQNALKFYESLGLIPQKIGMETIL